jgi:hypothetical protein
VFRARSNPEILFRDRVAPAILPLLGIHDAGVVIFVDEKRHESPLGRNHSMTAVPVAPFCSPV